MLHAIAGTKGLALAFILAQGAIAGLSQGAAGWRMPPDTAIPVQFTRTLRAGKARPGDPVYVKTMQIVHPGPGRDLPKGSIISGVIVEAKPLQRGVSASVLSFRFDRIETSEGVIPVHLYLRALANASDSEDASGPAPPADMNLSGTRALIGGDRVTPFQRDVLQAGAEEGGDPVGENLKGGVFERLRPAQAMDGINRMTCGGTATEQSVAIYSGDACGLYGFSTVYLAHAGKRTKGIIELESKFHNVILYSLSTALLQVATEEGDPTSGR